VNFLNIAGDRGRGATSLHQIAEVLNTCKGGHMEEVEKFMLKLVGLYNQNLSLMDGTTGPVKRLFEEARCGLGRLA
jgi:hypothetical protein